MDNYQEIVELNGRRKIEIHIKGGIIFCHAIKGTKLVINGSLGRHCKGMEINQLSNCLILKQKVRFTPILMVGFPKSVYLDIGIPEDMIDYLVINQDIGELTLEGLRGEKIEAKTKAAKLNVKDVLCDSLDLKVGSRPADIQLLRKIRHTNVQSISGEIKLEMAEVGGDLNCSPGAAGAYIKIPPRANVQINKSGIRKCAVKARLSGEQLYQFNLKANLGEIRVVN
ncbi:hypothetical protein [Bacillus wiedmannii]|uniref:Adhesin domain-containing protein n=1 Tax=Bacillus wiedmannii TaxID=1890302 RepID=A0AB73SMR7_9BACI|nr:hypothetical protein [Bacillus wiedmannii]PEK26721.1 hypothetical protein CN694_07900 [Bacillus wiedmannii]HDR3489704.1 hypothetical protein [Bacillus wiedmannii]HDR3494415.1 hypothetical protein [Bacillus wiedmannii]